MVDGALEDIRCHHGGSTSHPHLSVFATEVQEVVANVPGSAFRDVRLQDAQAAVLDGHVVRIDLHNPGVRSNAQLTRGSVRVVEVAQIILLGRLLRRLLFAAVSARFEINTEAGVDGDAKFVR